ncbi:MFS transporter [Comamonas thiooxydans]|uniref:MFS transporter n=1 Tax=Comamonas thiooxydans TaxID=363952 RepID=UPI000A2DFB8A|nr:MFS transporter [Comamonas thiooxydans]BDR07673.1 MFS transporter [Comamonas thiooxydans]
MRETGISVEDVASGNDEKSRGGIRWPLIALAFATFGIGTTEFGPMGFLPSIADDLQISIPKAGQIVSMYAIGVMVTGPIMTLLLMRLRMRTALMIAMVIFTLGNLLSALAPGYTTLLLARLLTSFNHGAFIGLGSIMAASLVPPHRKASAIAMMFMGITIANIGGVPAATWIGQYINWRWAFAGTAGLGFLAIAALWLTLPMGAPGKVPNVRQELHVLARPSVLIAIATSATGSAAMFTLYTYIAPILINITGASKYFITVALVLTGVGFTIGNGIGGRLADWSIDKATRIILGTLVVIMLAMPLALPNHLFTAFALLIWGAASFAIVPPMQTRVMQSASEAPGLAASINAGAFNFGNAVGAVVGGGVISLNLGYDAVPVAGGILALSSLILAMLGREHTG